MSTLDNKSSFYYLYYSIFDSSSYFYYQVDLDYDKREYQVLNINPYTADYHQFGERAGTPEPIKWYEYVNPPR